MITYEKLWETMKEKGISQYALIHKYKVSTGQLSRIRKNQYISTHTIEMLCKLIECNVADIMEYIPDPEDDEVADAGVGTEQDSPKHADVTPDYIIKA